MNNKGSGVPRTLPLHLFRNGSVFMMSELMSVISNTARGHSGFSFGVAAGARSAFMAAPTGDVRLARKVLKNLQSFKRSQLVEGNDEHLASRLDEDHGLLLRLMSQGNMESSVEDSWCCEMLVIPLPKPTTIRIPLDMLPRPYLRDAAMAYAFEDLPVRPYADRTTSHILNMLSGEAPGFRIATSEEILPIGNLLKKIAIEYKDDLNGFPLIFEPYQPRQCEGLYESLFYSPAAPTTLGPIQQPRIYGQFFEELHLRFERLKKAGLIPSWEWKFFGFQPFDSPLGIQVFYPAADNFADPSLSKFLNCIRCVVPKATFQDVVKPAKAGFFSRFIRFSQSSSIKNLPRAGQPRPSSKPVASQAISSTQAKTA